jgi:hypothetical protein
MLGKVLALGLSAAAVAGLAAPCSGQEKPVVICTKANAPAVPKLDDLPLRTSLSQYGMTWTFDKPARVGQFVNSHFCVVGPVTITETTPKPLYGAEIPAGELDATDKHHPENDRMMPQESAPAGADVECLFRSQASSP